MAFHSGDQLTLLQKWTTRASESQFNALSGAIGGFTSGIITCPLDVIKTKLQAQGGFVPVNKGRHVGHHKVYEGLLGTARVIWKEEGLRGMYRGLGPIILGYLPTWAVWFTVYTKSKEFFAERDVRNQFVINFWSSIVAGASSTVVTNPIWVIKTRLMSQSSRHVSDFPRTGSTPTSRPSVSSSWHYNSTLDAARKMYSSEGILSFYSGLTPALLGLSHVAVQFPAYEFLRQKFTGQRMGHMGEDNSQRQWVGVLSASILSKILASSATYPHEVIRTRLQTQRRPAAGSEYLQGLGVNPPSEKGVNGAGKAVHEPKYKGVMMTFRTILREEGWRAFYAGMGVNMARAVPAATVTMMTYEYVMKTLHEEKAAALQVMGRASSTPEIPEP
ncbi:mitochondrial carrier protein [Truncatella angustata]|uniref:Mitochondrial carrier protein n=1 Tax=Truncatella angustata TaxID=152316 RepID=A0A9P8UP94_9PEZI|nr:mitochondrial carrier protein [Truncatella angustata]KAH6655700.1 mitochondrial carrier protein [Truncatella angustata]